MTVAPLTGLLLVGLLTIGQEVDRLVDMLRYEEAGVVLNGQLVLCERVRAISGGGIALAFCRHATRLDGALGASD